MIRVVDSTGQEYTKVQVDKDATAANGKTVYSIFWLVPNQAYTVEINYNPGLDDDPEIDGIQDNFDDSILVPPASDPNDVLAARRKLSVRFPSHTLIESARKDLEGRSYSLPFFFLRLGLAQPCPYRGLTLTHQK